MWSVHQHPLPIDMVQPTAAPPQGGGSGVLEGPQEVGHCIWRRDGGSPVPVILLPDQRDRQSISAHSHRHFWLPHLQDSDAGHPEDL